MEIIDMFSPGEWVETLSGYGEVVAKIPYYYQDGEPSIPKDKKSGDFKFYCYLVKRLCSVSYKIYPKVELVNESILSEVDADVMSHINCILKVPKNEKRFSNLDEKLNIKSVCNIPFNFEDVGLIKDKLNGFSVGGQFTKQEIIGYIGDHFFKNVRNYKCYIQLTSDDIGEYDGRNQKLFDNVEVKLVE